MIQPSVSVIIPCYNHGEYLPEAVESVTRMERKDVELMLVDDGSTDAHTIRELDRLAARGIRILRSSQARRRRCRAV